MRTSIFILAMLMGGRAWSQAPLIQTISPVNTGPQGRVLISGSGFSASPSDLIVLFGNSRGTIASSTNFSIQVDPPPQARMTNIEVINVVSGLSGKSSAKFNEAFGGASFDPAKVSSPVSGTATRELFDVCSCDFDMDGKPDLAATKFSTVDDPSATDLILLKNNSTVGSLSFSQFDKTNLANLNLNAPTQYMNCGDLNGDGKPEIVATRAGGTKNVVFVLKNANTVAGTPAFSTAQSFLMDVGQFAARVSIHDLNLDGKPELIVTNSFDDPAGDNVVYIFVNQSTVPGGAVSFNATPVKVTITGANSSYGLDVQDIDGDQKPDLVLNQFNSNDLFILRNTSTSLVSFAAPVKIISGMPQINLGTADLNQDGLLDIMVTSDLINNSVSVFINQSTTGNISFKTPVSLTTSTQPWSVEGADVEGDGDIDMVVTSRQDNFINVFINSGGASPTFTRKDIATSKPSRSIRVGDLDGDAKPDFAFTASNGTAFTVDVLRNTNCVSPTILNPSPLTICSGQTLTLQTTKAFGVTYDWKESGVSFTGTPVANTYTTNITAAGNYTVTVTGEGGACAITSPSFAVTLSPGAPPSNPTINPVPTVCPGANLNLSTPATGVTYQWTGPAGFTSTSQNPVITNATSAQAGIYTLQVASGSCVSNTSTVTVDVLSFPTFQISAGTALPACAATGVNLSVNSVSGYTYQWLQNNAVITGQTSSTLAVTTEADYSVQATNASLGCSTTSAKLTVQLYTVPVAGFTGPTTACTGATVTFTNAATTDNRATPVYAWTFGDAQTAAVASPTHSYASSGTKTVSQTVSYSGVSGCSNVSSKSINVLDSVVPVITAPVTSSCPGDNVLLSITGSFNSINWTGGGTGNTLTVNKPGTYTVNTVDLNACPATGSFVLGAKAVPVLTVNADKTSVNQGETVQLTAAGADIYAWSPVAALTDPTIANPVATPQLTTSFVVKGTLNLGCSAIDSIKITVLNSGSLPAPLIFTPNGDGDNDLWRIPGIEAYPDCTMNVFDGHGSRVYERKGYINDWDGTTQGKQLPEQTYYYIFYCPNKTPLTGTVLIKR